MKSQKGFTLIELVIVIVILGILAAFIVPKFTSLEKEARYAAAQGVLGSIKGATAIAHATAIVKNPTSNEITLEGSTVTLVNGYPAATATGIGNALSDTGDLNPEYDPSTVPPKGTFTLNTDCVITYTQATATAAPVVVLTESTCKPS